MPSATDSTGSPDWFSCLDRRHCERMDVRPLLAAGTDPLTQILARVDALSPGVVLQIDAPFDPVPLRRLLAGRGYASHPVRLSGDHWQVFFHQQAAPELPSLAGLPEFPLMWQDGALDMDLRGLMPPNPMVAVLRIIEGGGAGDSFTVWLDRDPVHLYPELAERHWRAEVVEQDSDGVRVRISKESET
ncbi:MAG: DUF2249 domain-containing protein [Alphaproteobacteria bacterium]|nr:DUF2249 domain-containing protein [Alphaproteobacteria bacterium]